MLKDSIGASNLKALQDKGGEITSKTYRDSAPKKIVKDKLRFGKYPYGCNLSIGRMCCSLTFSEKLLAESIRNYYQGCLCEKMPDFTVDVEMLPQDQVVQVQDLLFRKKEVQGEKFSFLDGLIEGNVDLENRHVELKARKQVLVGNDPKLFEQFLIQVYHAWEEIETESPSFMVHGCGVIRKGQGFIFTGPSGSGKTTVASFASKEDVLNDEIVFIERHTKNFYLRSTPFGGSFIGNKDLIATLKAIFFLEHADTDYLEKIGPIEAGTEFLKQIIFPQPLLSEGTKETFVKMSDFSAEIAGKIDFYKLYFQKSENFFRLVDGLASRVS